MACLESLTFIQIPCLSYSPVSTMAMAIPQWDSQGPPRRMIWIPPYRESSPEDKPSEQLVDLYTNKPHDHTHENSWGLSDLHDAFIRYSIMKSSQKPPMKKKWNSSQKGGRCSKNFFFHHHLDRKKQIFDTCTLTRYSKQQFVEIRTQSMLKPHLCLSNLIPSTNLKRVLSAESYSQIRMAQAYPCPSSTLRKQGHLSKDVDLDTAISPDAHQTPQRKSDLFWPPGWNQQEGRTRHRDLQPRRHPETSPRCPHSCSRGRVTRQPTWSNIGDNLSIWDPK